jgi:integrase
MGKVVYNQLTVKRVSSIRNPGRYTDGLGLHLYVDASGAKRWVMRVCAHGCRRDIGLGSVNDVPLAEARRRRDELRSKLRDGEDLFSLRGRPQVGPSFEDYARKYHLTIAGDWKNAKHAQQWINTLIAYVFPIIGKMPVGTVDAAAIKKALEPIWTEKPETARRVRQRIGRVISAAISENLHPGPNPAPDATTALSARRPKAKKFAAMPYREVPAFFQRLDASDLSPSARLAFQFLILTAGRTGEIIGARWSEIDSENAEWTIPADRMKAGESHIVPLSAPALDILSAAHKLFESSEHVFPAMRADKPLSNMTLLQALRRFKEPYTTHGFRSSFRDWAEEKTNYQHAVKEAALAHTVRNKVEAAYRRTTLLEKRRLLMDDWGRFLRGGSS